MKNDELKTFPKYCINKYVNTITRKVIERDLKISQPTFWRKSNVLVGDPNGFEICQLKQIADILERDIMDLLTTEAKIYYRFINQNLTQ